jgi:hypothetical protein
MWVVGIILLLCLVSLFALLLAHKRRAAALPLLWDIPRVAGAYMGIVGTLAGFTVGSSFFLANLFINTGMQEFETVMGMFLMTFLVLVGTGMMYGTLPNYASGKTTDNQFMVAQQTIYILGNTGYYIGISIAWLSLRPLLISLNLRNLADLFSWLLLFVILAGGTRLSLFVYRLTLASRLTVSAVPIVGFLAATLYRLGVAPLLPGLWPSTNVSLNFAVVAFILNAVGFSAGTYILVYQGANAPSAAIVRRRDTILLVYVQAVTTVIMLLWYAVVLP